MKRRLLSPSFPSPFHSDLLRMSGHHGGHHGSAHTIALDARRKLLGTAAYQLNGAKEYLNALEKVHIFCRMLESTGPLRKGLCSFYGQRVAVVDDIVSETMKQAGTLRWETNAQGRERTITIFLGVSDDVRDSTVSQGMAADGAWVTELLRQPGVGESRSLSRYLPILTTLHPSDHAVRAYLEDVGHKHWQGPPSQLRRDELSELLTGATCFETVLLCVKAWEADDPAGAVQITFVSPNSSQVLTSLLAGSR